VSGFLEELGKKAAERWLTLLLLPGLLWTAALLAATQLHHDNPLDLTPALHAATHWTENPHTPTTLAVVLAAVLLIASATGLAADGVAALLRRLWTIPGNYPPARWLTQWRHHRWIRHDHAARHTGQTTIRTTVKNAPLPVDPDADTPIRIDIGPDYTRALARRDTVSLEPPSRPAWIGDRWQSTLTRVYRVYGLDLTIAWPRLWTILPDTLRADIITAHTHYASASSLTAWALLYTVPTIHYWPISAIVLVTAFVGITRARTAANTLCQLVETATELHTHVLAQQLAPPNPTTGHTINRQILKPPPTTP
jgi:hypothetical protein